MSDYLSIRSREYIDSTYVNVRAHEALHWPSASDDPPIPGSLPHCEVYNSSNFTITSATDTTLTFDSEDSDTNNMHSGSTPSRIYLPSDGLYFFHWQIDWVVSTTGVVSIKLELNADGAKDFNSWYRQESGTEVAMGQGAIRQCSADDYVEMIVYQNSGSSKTVYANHNTMLRVFQLSAS